ncbi:MAG: ABC-F family ATP-binding cassette domain-containing protein [Lachnospiraceae bacterium]|nr:ABC-F family ATP-binding cassette domain-containing protein [Lachnospiraceae bacterium]
MLINVRNADISYGDRLLIKDISFEVRNTEKIALVGRNGCGKTTFLRLLGGEIEPDAKDGNEQPHIEKRPGLTTGWLTQMTFTDDSAKLGDEIRKVFLPVIEMKKRLDELIEMLDTAPDEALAKEYAALEERYNYMGGYRADKDYELVLSRFGFTPEDEERPLSEFSGGQRTKIAFIKLLLSKPDILILDEPTNHLDISTIDWLEGYIREYPRAVICVSHDRLFLDRTAEVVYEIENKKLTRYTGNYSDYIKLKDERYEKQKKDYEAQQKEIERLKATAERFIHKATKASMAKSKLKAIEHMDIIEAPEEYELKAFHASTKPAVESGFDVIEAKGLSFGYDRVLGKIDISIKKNEKYGFIGGNGLGKSTLLKTLAGKLKPLGGSYRYGHNVEAGYFDQQMAQYVSDKTVYDDFHDIYPYLTETEVRNRLGGFLFSGDDVFKPVNLLSGGEKVRLALAKIVEKRPNLLFLDEPTNHVDIVGREALEKMLKEYEGTLVLVSHDRYLISRVTDKLVLFSDKGAEVYPFGYEEYERERKNEKKASVSDIWNIDGRSRDKKDGKDVPDKEQPKASNPGKELSKAKRRMERLEFLLEENDKKRSLLEEELMAPENATDYEKLGKLQDEIGRIEEQSDAYMKEWEELSELC